MVINIDFDGTCVTHEYPNIGKDIGAIPVLKRLVAAGHQLILFTMRGNGTGLDEAVKWFEENDIPLYGIQTNPTQSKWTDSPKSYAHLTIDDAALGCPVLQEFNNESVEGGVKKTPIGRPFVNWLKIELGLMAQGILPEIKKEDGNETTNNV